MERAELLHPAILDSIQYLVDEQFHGYRGRHEIQAFEFPTQLAEAVDQIAVNNGPGRMPNEVEAHARRGKSRSLGGLLIQYASSALAKGTDPVGVLLHFVPD